MPKTTPAAARPRESTVLKDPRYDSRAAANALNSYEKILLQRETAVKAILRRAPRRHACADKGDLSLLFATIH
jgi:hypothetical protein